MGVDHHSLPTAHQRQGLRQRLLEFAGAAHWPQPHQPLSLGHAGQVGCGVVDALAYPAVFHRPAAFARHHASMSAKVSRAGAHR